MDEWKSSSEDSAMVIHFLMRLIPDVVGKSDKIDLFRQTNSSSCIKKRRGEYFSG